MNTKVVYAAGAVLLMIGIVFYFVNSGFLPSDKPESSSTTTNSHPVTNTPTTTTTTTTTKSPSISSSAYVNNSKTNNPNVVKPSSYQLLLSLPLYSSTVDSERQILANALHLNQPKQQQQQQSVKQHQQQPQLSLIPTIPLVFAQSSSNYQNLTVSVKSVKVLNENNVTSLQLALDVHNPNRGAAILETLNYNVYFNNVRLASADIGAKPQGFVDSLGSVYPIIGNQTITLKDTQPLTPEGSALFDSNGHFINNSSLKNISKSQKMPTNFYLVNGTFSTTLDRGTQSQSSETPYSLKFPLK
ncbi:MAG: hypothetical protein ACTHKJ_06360 [Candidatus Nitrosocosmicus sp.]